MQFLATTTYYIIKQLTPVVNHLSMCKSLMVETISNLAKVNTLPCMFTATLSLR